MAWKGQRKAIPVPSPAPELTFPGEGALAHTRVTELNEGVGTLLQPQAGQQDVPATYVPVNQILVLLGWQRREKCMVSRVEPRSHRPALPCKAPPQRDSHVKMTVVK